MNNKFSLLININYSNYIKMIVLEHNSYIIPLVQSKKSGGGKKRPSPGLAQPRYLKSIDQEQYLW